MAHHRAEQNGLTIIVTDMCFRCGCEGTAPHGIEPGDAFTCSQCKGTSEVSSRFSKDGKVLCIWFTPFDRTVPAPR